MSYPNPTFRPDAVAYASSPSTDRGLCSSFVGYDKEGETTCQTQFRWELTPLAFAEWSRHREGQNGSGYEARVAPTREYVMLGRGLINAGMLDGPKARLFLSLLLRASKEEVAETFERRFGG
jgi:hypothetical protein